MRERDVGREAPGCGFTEQLPAQRVEVVRAFDAGQEHAVRLERLGSSETQGQRTRRAAVECGAEIRKSNSRKLVLAAQGDMRGNQASLQRIEQFAHRLQQCVVRRRHVEAQLDAPHQAAHALPARSDMLVDEDRDEPVLRGIPAEGPDAGPLVELPGCLEVLDREADGERAEFHALLLRLVRVWPAGVARAGTTTPV